MKLLHFLIGFIMCVTPVWASDADVFEAVVDYMDFATYESGIILPAQLDQDVFDAAVFVDTRDAEQFAAGHIAGAVNIEWRDIPSRLSELPETGLVVLYCNTGTLSSQATFAARLLGRENVVVLQTGMRGWSETAVYKPE
ncbi:rhodanese-like domain-containing protein [Shimia litoralis]|uniref:Rhodanese-like domain-containing protein n=1 Tax=Shimia litoralis TaxID=420403 RepID=A0A4U7N7U0_9RHOB|nr:rhodanese-like domain-containing protein [Shimia litoralis]TKZ21757.1 rhodanese-like domain-containing protein [Shimia litoralis]